MPVFLSPHKGAISDSLGGSVQRGREYFHPTRGGGTAHRESIAARSHCPVPCLSPGPLSSPRFHPTAFHPHFTLHVLFCQRFCHPLLPSSCSMASQAASPGQAHLFPLPLHLSLFPISCFPPFSSLPLSFFQDLFQMLLLHPGSSHPPCPLPHQPSFPAVQGIPPGWIPLGPHRRALAPAWPVQPPGARAVLNHSLQGQDLFERYMANI